MVIIFLFISFVQRLPQHLIMKTISNTRVNIERDMEERPYIGIYLPTPTLPDLKNIEHIVL